MFFTGNNWSFCKVWQQSSGAKNVNFLPSLLVEKRPQGTLIQRVYALRNIIVVKKCQYNLFKLTVGHEDNIRGKLMLKM